MKAIIAAGGSGSRMAPATRFVNKHLLPVGGGKLMIDKPIEFLRLHNFAEITVVTGANHAAQIVEYVGDGHQYGFKRVEYAFQPKPAGISDILNRVSHGGTENGVLLILGDNAFSAVQESVHLLRSNPDCAVAWEFDVGSPELAQRFGQYMTDGEKGWITEKPLVAVHSRILTGLYYFPADVFDKVNKLSPSARGELEITDLLSLYLGEGRLSVHEVVGSWCDLGEWNSWEEFIVRNK